MKILQIVQRNQLRGAEVFASQLSNQLLKSNDVTMVGLFKGNAVLPFNGEFITLERPVKRRLFDFEGYQKLADIVRDRKIDVVQANAGDTLKFAVFSKVLFRWRIPIVYRNASMISFWIDSPLKLIFNRFLVRQVDRVISVSKLCKTDFIKTFPSQQRKVTMIEIGVNLRDINTIPSDLAQIFDRGPVLVQVGALEAEKNQMGLLRIFKRVRYEIPNAQLIIVGTGSLEAPLKSYADSLGISQGVHFAGQRGDILEIVKACKAFLLTSEVEGLPGVILESMFCKTPVITYNVGGVSEVVELDTGWLINKNDEEMFAATTIELVSGRQMTTSKVDKAYERVITYFNNAQIAQRFESVYTEVVKRK